MKLTFRFPYWLAVTIFAIETALRALNGAWIAVGIWGIATIIVAYAWRQEQRIARKGKAAHLLLSTRPADCDQCGAMVLQVVATGTDGSTPISQIGHCRCTEGENK